MYAIIIGAGAISRQIAANLCHRRNDVVVIERDEQQLEKIKEQLDIMPVLGNGATAEKLLEAGITRADMLMAITDDAETNILACSIAQHFDVPLKIARIHSDPKGYFPGEKGLTADMFGVDHALFAERKCVDNIVDALERPPVKETVRFLHSQAELVNFQLPAASPMIGYQLREFPRPELLEQLRVCAVLRRGELIIPRGNTGLLAQDEIYVAGKCEMVKELLDWAAPTRQKVKRVVIAGATLIGRLVAAKLSRRGMDLGILEAHPHAAREMAEVIGGSALIFQAESTTAETLQEAGVGTCDAFIACHQDNETNILSCIMAKRLGAKKVITVTDNAEYVNIIAGISFIDCCFSPLVAAVNELTRHIGTNDRRTLALLKRTPAEVMELTVQSGSDAEEKEIQSLKCPDSIALALIQRQGELVPAIGAERLREGDRVVTIATPDSVEEAEKLFTPKRLLS